MISPPMSLPSPVPSSSSSHHPHTFSSMPPPALHRGTSAASGISGHSGRDSKASGHVSNGSAIPDDSHSASQITPQPHHSAGYQHPHPSQHPFLPAVTSSPPPHAPLYVPPPQHALPPDPIHTQMSQPGMTSPTGQWPGGPNGWHGPPGQQGFPGPGQQFSRQLPNGHLPGSSSHNQLPPNPGTYSGRMSMPPLGMNGRPGSRQGESRDRRRDRDGRDERDGDEDVITTIFVVGFPDDMLEREFQNIFTFSRGFEAATLKYPSGAARPREPAAALLAELQILAANPEFGETGIPQPLEEALAALQFSTASSSSTTPSAAISMTPSAPTGPVLGGAPYSSQSSRRQTIGFARFRTRADALAAREQLQGRKIDTLTGATLKAEMAKKNLHTKRTTSGEELVGLLLRSGRLAGLMGAGGTGTGLGAGVGQSGGPSNLPNLPNLPNGSGTGGPQQPPIQHQPSSAIPTAHQPQSAKEAWDSWPSQQSSQPSSHESRLEERLGQSGFNNNQYYQPNHGPPNGGPGPSASELSNTSASPPVSITSPNTRPTDSKALLALAEEADEMEGWTVGGMSMGFDNYTPRRPQAQAQPIHSGSYPGGGFAAGQGRDLFGSSPPAGSDQMSDAGRSMGMMSSGPNPADQNPPINTLYVGNLPAISPPALPPNFLEESLRSMFETCPGYKRMSFRQKVNGPMCFVEFEDIHFAANCIQNLYGHTLSGLVKGGIRLSYSKNSLGQRGVNHSGPGGPGFAGAMPGMGMIQGYNQNPNSAGPGSSFGLQLQGQGHSAPPGPSTAPMPINHGHHQHFTQSAPNGAPLSPNAQPFALPQTSPRSRYFANGPGSGPGPASVPVPVPNSKSNPNASFQAFQSPNSAGTSSQFSPVGSPIRTPGSFSWVSSGSGMNGNGGYGGFTLGSLDGAASAWGSAATAQQN